MSARRGLARASGPLIAVAVLALLSGCSQVSALAPVSGDTITTLRIAIDDVLIENGVAIMVAPKCTAVAKAYTCKGSTADGAEILATSANTEPRMVTVSVGGTVLYDGDVDSVVQKAAEVRQ